ncbi:MAG: hypothetical protein HUN04_22690 [Desulfobacter sp.]|nr:MAG: hypothetical protein HUN04_22690 [Desulfobacter sp.]
MAIATKSFDQRCRQHMAEQGITSKEKLQHKLQSIFEEADHQEAALIGLYKMLIPDWDKLDRLEGFPIIGQEMWRYIGNLFIHYDQEHHPKVFNGGLWLNNGFSSSEDLGPWEISLSRCNVIYS